MGAAALSSAVLIRKRPSVNTSNCLPPVFTSNPPPAMCIGNSATGMLGGSVFPVTVIVADIMRLSGPTQYTPCHRASTLERVRRRPRLAIED